MIAELRTYLTTRPSWEFRLWMGCLAVAVLLALPPTLWPWLIFAVSVAAAMGLGVRVWQLRRQLGTKESECQRLHLLLTEAEISAPVPFVPVKPVLRVVREASPYDFPLADDSWFDRLYDEKGEHRG